jgi:hypothetical protein
LQDSGFYRWFRLGQGKWKFMRKADYPTEANGYNMGLAAYKKFCFVRFFYHVYFHRKHPEKRLKTGL